MDRAAGTLCHLAQIPRPMSVDPGPMKLRRHWLLWWRGALPGGLASAMPTGLLAKGPWTRYSLHVMDHLQAACGPHAEIVRTEGIRISRCPCGTVHVHFSHNGLTVQLSPEHFAEAVQAMSLARSLLSGDPARPLQGRVDRPEPGRFVTVATYDPKKSPNN